MFLADETLDFHELGILDHFDIEKILTEFIENSYNKDHTQVLVITGKGQVVRPLVKKLLEKSKYVEEFRYAGYFNGQSGAFEVTLKD